MRWLLIAVLLASQTFLSFSGAPIHAREEATAAGKGEYRLGSGDRIRINVYGEESLSGEFAVSGAGTLSLPLVGELPVAGRTLSQVQQALTQRLAAGFVREPRVSAEVIEYRPFYILGEVNKPGQYPFRVGLTVHQAVATAEGFTYRANTRRVLIRHDGSDEEVEVKLSASTPVRPGDTIRVKERFF